MIKGADRTKHTKADEVPPSSWNTTYTQRSISIFEPSNATPTLPQPISQHSFDDRAEVAG